MLYCLKIKLKKKLQRYCNADNIITEYNPEKCLKQQRKINIKARTYKGSTPLPTRRFRGSSYIRLRVEIVRLKYNWPG